MIGSPNSAPTAFPNSSESMDFECCYAMWASCVFATAVNRPRVPQGTWRRAFFSIMCDGSAITQIASHRREGGTHRRERDRFYAASLCGKLSFGYQKMSATFTPEQVAAHNTESSCWIIARRIHIATRVLHGGLQCDRPRRARERLCCACACMVDCVLMLARVAPLARSKEKSTT